MIRTTAHFGVNINIEDKNLSCSRPVIGNQMFQSGDDIQVIKQKVGSKRETKVYSISFAKNIFVEEDLSKNCMDYPNRKFETYKRCEDTYIHKFFSTHQLNPIWAPDLSKNISRQTHLSNLPSDFKHHFANMVTGVQSSKCLLPCTTVSVSTKLLREVIQIKIKTAKSGNHQNRGKGGICKILILKF